jgi:predicted transposase/invertase (TIGR01784 family)
MEDREMYESIFERVYKERGRQEGRQEEKIEIAGNLLSDGISPEIVARNTGLSQEEIRTLMN